MSGREELEIFPPDIGCFLHKSCRGDPKRGIPECPEPVCVYEIKGGQIALEALKQRIEIKRLKAAGQSIDEIAGNLHIGVRTVYRALARND